MRIIAGTKRGMRLLCPRTQVTRPITDRVKEALFNILQNYDLLSGARVADLFCGVGSLGLEALSRGAAYVTFVEKDQRVAAVLEKNIARADFIGQSRIARTSAFRVGAPVGPGGERCDLVFVDPPYAATREVGAGSALADLLALLGEQVAARGVVVVRTHHGIDVRQDTGSFHVIDGRTWGTMSIVLLQAGTDEQQARSD